MSTQFQPWDNPMGTAGFEFIEYTAPDPIALRKVFELLGFKAIAKHRHKDVTLYRQGGINFLINAEPDSFAQRFARLHGPSICAIGFRVEDAARAYKRALELGAWGFDSHSGPMELNIPAIKASATRSSTWWTAGAARPAMAALATSVFMTSTSNRWTRPTRKKT